MLDFGTADKQQVFELIPDRTIVPVHMTVRPGGMGDGGWLKQSKSSDAQMLDCEFTVTEGPFFKRKFWQNMTVSGGKTNENGESIAWNITRQTLRAILESARNINPDDVSQAAMKGRVIQSWGELDNLEFLVEVKIQKGTGGYNDQNQIRRVIVPGDKDYQRPTHQAQQMTAHTPAPAATRPAAPSIPKPAWA